MHSGVSAIKSNPEFWPINSRFISSYDMKTHKYLPIIINNHSRANRTQCLDLGNFVTHVRVTGKSAILGRR